MNRFIWGWKFPSGDERKQRAKILGLSASRKDGLWPKMKREAETEGAGGKEQRDKRRSPDLAS